MSQTKSRNLNIKNYTSQVPVSRSVQRIEDCLIKFGAKNILKIIDNGKITGLAFVVSINGKDFPFKLPARIDKIVKHFQEKSKSMTASAATRAFEQAERTAWRLLHELIEIQMSLIHLEQTEIMEIFMPYIFDSTKNETLFEKMKKEDFNLLEHK